MSMARADWTKKDKTLIVLTRYRDLKTFNSDYMTRVVHLKGFAYKRKYN